MARPVEYNEEVLTKASAYIAECVDEIDEYHKTRGEKSDSYDRLVRVKLPTIEGLALYLNIDRTTVYAWEQTYPEFSHILSDLRALQADRLINAGLSGDYNPVIAKVLLTKHGYNDKQEIDHTTKGEKIDSSDAIKDLTQKLNELHRTTSS